MSEATTIQHKGYIEEVTEGGVKVKFISESACAACHAKGVCSAADMEEKEVFIPGEGKNHKVGEVVNIVMTSGQGSRAVLMGYVYPFFLFLIALLVSTSLGMNELRAGLLSLALLIPYYTVLYIFRDKINQKFSFSLGKEG